MRYKERVIKHNIDIPELRTVGYSDMTEIYYDPSVISHHPRSFEYYFTHGIVVNEKRYIIKEFFVRESKLYAVITEDEVKYYELYLSFMEEDTIERIKKELEELDEHIKNIKIPEAKQNQTLALSGRVLSISDGNTIQLPNDKQTISKSGNKVLLSNDGGEIELPAPYDDSSVVNRLKALETKEDKDTKYKAKGNGLFLDSDNNFHIEMVTKKRILVPYLAIDGDVHIPLTADKRYENSLMNSISYAIDNDGTENVSPFIEAGILFDFEMRYTYNGAGKSNMNGHNHRLSGIATSGTTIAVSDYASLYSIVVIDSDIYANWKDSNNKVSISLKPKVVWAVKLESHTEYYTHYVTKEELDSAEPIEIEVKEGENVIGRLNLTLKNVRFYVQSVFNDVFLKNPSDNRYYTLPRLQ